MSLAKVTFIKSVKVRHYGLRGGVVWQHAATPPRSP